MNLKEIIKKRASVRTFKSEEVNLELINEILHNGNLAPTAGNIQPWEFIIVGDKYIKEQIVKTTYIGADAESSNVQKWMLNAPVFVVVCGDREKVSLKYGESDANVLLYLDCSACIENMLLTVVDLGLSSCYVTGFRVNELSKVLNLPSDIIPIAILPIGYTDKENIRNVNKVDVESKIHLETY